MGRILLSTSAGEYDIQKRSAVGHAMDFTEEVDIGHVHVSVPLDGLTSGLSDVRGLAVVRRRACLADTLACELLVLGPCRIP